MSGHTPGPWRVENGRTVWGGHGFFQKLAELEGCNEQSNLDTSLADLHLIAAAPELLDALCDLVRHDRAADERDHLPACMERQRAEDIIAKAEGRS